MKVKIYRGTKEIGGTCVELTANNGKILWIDIGSPLDNKNPNVDYVKNKVDAVLISHPHMDHFGLVEHLVSEVPVYIGELGYDLINATKIFTTGELLKGNFQTFKPWKKFTIASTFKITPFLTDHSTPEAFAFLIEVDGKRVFYSGDFRATGRKEDVFHRLIEKPPGDIDLLLMEGTMVERTNHLYQTEQSVEAAMDKIFGEQKNVSFVISSAQNLDRFISVFKACRKNNKILVIDVYTAWILDEVSKKSKGTPGIEWKELKVYEHPGQLNKIKNKSFDEFKNRVKAQSAGNGVFRKPMEFVYFVRCPNEALVNKLRGKEKINVIYSQWEGYLKKEHANYCTDNINALKEAKDISFQSIHTSGHATVPDLKKFAKALKAKMIVPIHTAFPVKFKEELEKEGMKNVCLWEDGKEYKL